MLQSWCVCVCVSVVCEKHLFAHWAFYPTESVLLSYTQDLTIDPKKKEDVPLFTCPNVSLLEVVDVGWLNSCCKLQFRVSELSSSLPGPVLAQGCCSQPSGALCHRCLAAGEMHLNGFFFLLDKMRSSSCSCVTFSHSWALACLFSTLD